MDEEEKKTQQQTGNDGIPEGTLEGAKPTKRQALNDRWKGMIPDYDPEDDEGSAEKVSQWLDNESSQKEKIAEAMKKDPRVAQLLVSLINGEKSAGAALARYFGKDLLNAEEGTPEYDEIVKAEEERKAEQEASEASRKEYQNNLEQSMPGVESFCKEKGLDVDTFLDDAWEKLVHPILSGLYSREVCESLHKALSYDQDVQDAGEAGYVKGRNENIHKMREQAGDGLPKITGSETPKEKKANKGNGFLELASQA